MRTGNIISGIGHGVLILWLLVGGFFTRATPPELPETTDVSILSEEEFAALMPANPGPRTAEAAPEVTAPTVDSSPAPQPRPDTQPETAPAPETPAAPVPDPVVTELPDPLPPRPGDVSVDAPDMDLPVTPDDPGSVTATREDDRPTPEDIPRVAPEPVAPSLPDLAIDDTPAPPVADTAETTEVAEPDDASAPEAATTEIVTEAEKPTTGVTSSPRPKARPPRPEPRVAEIQPQPEPDPAPTPQPDPTPDTPPEAAIDDAVAAALGDVAGTPEATGAPLPQGEQDNLRRAMEQCWVLDNGSPAASVVIVLGMQMERDGSVISNSIRQLSATGGDSSAQNIAFETARRAVLRWSTGRCGGGYKLPSDMYDSWRNLELVFNPESMRTR